MFFVDSWVWLEFFLEDEQWREAEAILERLQEEEGVISTTVLLEVTYRLRRTVGRPRADRVATAIQSFDNLTVAPVNTSVALTAAELRDEYYRRGDRELSYADAIHVATALLSGCHRLYSGDPDFEDVDEVETVIV